MYKRILSILLSVLLVMSIFAACGSNNDTDTKQPSAEDEKNSTTESKPNDENENKDPDNTAKPGVPGENQSHGTVDSSVTYIGQAKKPLNTIAANGMSYRGDNKKYGVMSLDGKFDSGDIYYRVDVVADCFVVQTQQYGDPENVDLINSIGMIDGSGNVIIPAEYAMIKPCNDRYLRVFKAISQTTDEEEALLRMTSSMFSITAQDGDILYAGEWYIYDLQTGAKVPGVMGTENGYINLNGDVLSYTEKGQKIRKNAAGEDIPTDASLFENGTYIPYGEKAVYGSDNQKRFAFADNGYTPYSWENGYYVMSKYQSSKSYALADEAGNICSAEFAERIYALGGGLIGTSGGVYDLDGNQLLDKAYNTSAYKDGKWLVQDTEKNVYLINSDHTVELICKVDNVVYYLERSNFAVTKKEGSTYCYYSAAQKTFVEGYVCARTLAERKIADNTKELIDTETDTVLLSGYSRYGIYEDEQGVRYIYASYQDANYETHMDLFRV